MRFLFTFLIIISNISAFSQKNNVDLTNISQELTKTGGQLPNRYIAIWFSLSLWKTIGQQMQIPPESIKIMNDKLKNYMMFGVVDMSIKSNDIKFIPEVELRENISLIDSSNNIYKPLNNDSLPLETKNFINQFKPLITSLYGKFGDGVHIFLFPIHKLNGSLIVNESQSNHFSLKWNQTNVKWKLPLAALMPSKYCPIDKEEMKGNWYYCPFHGVRLPE